MPSSLAASETVVPAASLASAWRSLRTICSGECLLPIKSPPNAHCGLSDSHSNWLSFRGAGHEGVRDSQKVAQLVEEDYVPLISEMPGFVAYYCVDAGDGVMVSTSVFEHKDAEEQSTFLAGEFTVEDLGPLSPNPPQITAGEVVAYKVSS